MHHNDRLITVRAMKEYGGSFVKALAEALLQADENNAGKIERAFGDYMDKYGPGSAMFNAVSKVEA